MLHGAGGVAAIKSSSRYSATIAIAAITLAALVLRLFAARGGLWLDEAWSAMFAHDAATPIGVFLNVNHDNNHHLNTLWLQFVGDGASPLLQRGLSIAAGTATVPVAAAIAARRGRAAGIVAALLFAFAPILVTYGSEARGYAPMLLAWVCAIGVVDRWLGDPGRPSPGTAIALAALIGCLAQATMVFALAALGLWVMIDRTRIAGIAGAVQASWRLFLPAFVVTCVLAGVLWSAAHADPHGFQMGNREPHDWIKWLLAIDQLWSWSLGLDLLVTAVALFGAIVRDRIGGLALLAAAALPLAVAVLALPNSGASRYYIVAVPPVLLWCAIALPRAWAAGRGWRVLATLVAGVAVIGAVTRDATSIANLRGDPARAVAVIAAAKGAAVSVELPRSTAILTAAARSQPYPLAVRTAPCPAAPFHFIERDGDAAFSASPVVCGTTYTPVAGGDPTGLSGTHWRLYAHAR